jgi:hypothetical protein
MGLMGEKVAGLAQKPETGSQSADEAEHRTLNIEHPTSNAAVLCVPMFDVECSMLDVRLLPRRLQSSGFLGQGRVRG